MTELEANPGAATPADSVTEAMLPKTGSGGEPIAIVGMACKFPGAPDIAGLWRLLESGGNAITEGVPGSGVGRIGRFYPPSAAPYPACRYAALVDDIDRFDAEFFRISPVEAQLLDPQHRMTLETCWQALEDAGIDPERLRGSSAGVIMGVSNNDYRGLSLSSAGQTTEPAASLYTLSGTSFNTLAGRVCYALGLEGPALILDTACSSSLVAVHLAVSALRQREANLILAGGTQAIFSGLPSKLRAQAGMLSPDGQCKAFDASANGFVRGEGCGVVALKRLSDAQADGDPIWGLVLGSAMNQDGASQGLTVPSASAQVKVIEDALRQAGVAPAEVDYLEAHGTGTEVGDPIELNSAAAAYGRGRDASRPLLVGSIKTNVGHLEPTAGIAGLMKAVLAMQHGTIPKHLHFNEPNPRVDWANLPVRITDQKTDWPATNGRRPLAGVSSYGWSGTNAHVIVEGYGPPAADKSAAGDLARPAGPVQIIGASAPSVPSASAVGRAETRQGESADKVSDVVAERPARLLPLSGKSAAALKDVARSYLSWLEDNAGDASLPDLAWSASVSRSHFDWREGVVFRDGDSLRKGLQAIADSNVADSRQAAAKVAFVYTGQGNQWVGMGRDLYQSEPVFRAVLDRCDCLIREERGASLLDVMFGRPGSDGDLGDLDEPRWTQPAIYALECGLTALWESVGIRPVAVLGHSLGEIAAAQAAGVFTLEEGMKFASARGRLLGALPRAGAMAAVFAPAERVAAAVAEWRETHPDSDLSIGVDNGTHQVISGPAEEVHELADKLESDGVNVRRLRPSPAYHSPLVEPALDDLAAVFDDIAVAEPAVPLVSNVTGRPLPSGELMNGAYWRRHARQPVAFRRGVETLAAELGVDAVIELGPHAILGPLVSLNWPQGNGPQGGGPVAAPLVWPSLLRPSFDGSEPERADAFALAVAGAYQAGLPVDFRGLFAGEERRRVALPGYPFQRRLFWLPTPQRRVSDDGHPLLGARHESPRGEVMFATEMFPSEPAWLKDHRVYGRVIMPGALYGAMAATMPLAEGSAGAVVEELQLHNPWVYPEYDPEDVAAEPGRRVQLVVDGAKPGQPRQFEIFSKGDADEDWTLHAEGRLAPAGRQSLAPERIDPAALKAGLQPQDLPAYYRAKAATGIDLGPAFRSLEGLWGAGGEAVGEVALQVAAEGPDAGIHPLLLDGCFQVLSATRSLAGVGGEATYLPFAWERLWLNGPLPERLLCHARLRDTIQDTVRDAEPGAAGEQIPETLTGDLWLYSLDGRALGGFTGFVLKRATRASLLSATEEIQDLLYEIVWRDRPLPNRLQPADALTSPSAIGANTATYAEYLAAEGVGMDDRAALLHGLERLSRAYALAALDKLGWQRQRGAVINPEELREQLGVLAEHSRLLERMLRLLADGGLLEPAGDGGYRVVVAAGESLPDAVLSDPEPFADQMLELHPHGSNELGLLRRSGSALAEVLRGEVDPLSILFPTEGPGLADFYFTAPASRCSNRILGDAVAAVVADWPADRRLRILEVGAGTGSGTSVVLPELPAGNFDYMFTDISAGFFSAAEERFADTGIPLEYRPLDIERNPADQGFNLHAYDLVIAVNVLHATRSLGETLGHCRDLLAPSGQLLALENLRGRGWQDMIFGQLDGWWRYSDPYRPHHALASPEIWRQALADAAFDHPTVLGGENWGDEGPLGSGVIMAQGPAEIAWPPGLWVLAVDAGGYAEGLARELAALNQTVVVAGDGVSPDTPGITHSPAPAQDRAAWQELLAGLPQDLPLSGVVHCAALQGHGTGATTEQLAADARQSGAGALALVQAMQDADLVPANGLWLLTRGAQALERDYLRDAVGELAGAALWGFGKALAREVGHLQPRMIDLDPAMAMTPSALVNELLFPDAETHVAHRAGSRLAARLVRAGRGRPWLSLPQDKDWRLVPNPGDGLAGLQAEPAVPRPLESGEVRVAVAAAGLNFSDVLISVGAVEMEPMLGDEFCGRITEVAPDVADVAEFAIGDRVLGLGIGALRPDLAVCADLVAHAPAEVPVEALATIPTAFVSAELSFQMSGLRAGDRVLIHTASGGVGLAAVQLAQAAGAEVFATASAPKQAYLRSLGINHVYDSRTTDFGRRIREDTQGAGVTVVLNSLTGPGYIEANLDCLAANGRFVEMGRRDIWTAAEMAAARPDVAYSVLEVDALKRQDPATAGASLRRVMARVAAGELKPLAHTRWPLAEIGAAMEFMRSTRHIGKNVIAMPPLADGRLRPDRTYLVTGGLGGIGIVVAGWLAERGAGVIVLNGRRPPDPEAAAAIETLRQQGADVRVELADMTDSAAVDAMLARIDANLPPLAGVIHSVGVLSDGALGNQTWERFEQVMWPKMLGAWQLHRATLDKDLDLFVLFSSAVGVMGNSGQANHAAANAFLDQLAGYRRSLGLPGQAIAWGAWSELGEAAEQRERIESQLRASGSDWISPQQGLQAFDELMRQDRTFSVVTAVDWPVRADSFVQRPTFLEELLLEEEAAGAEADGDGPADLLTQLRDGAGGDWEGILTRFLQRELQAVLRLPTAPTPTVGFFDLGMDSLMSVELRNRLNRNLSGQYVVSNTAVFDYPNVTALAGHLGAELAQALDAAAPEPAAAPASRQPEPARATDEDAIAIIGMACRFPGAPDLESFWALLESGAHAITDGRREAGPWAGVVGDPNGAEPVYRRGGFVDGIDRFDNRFFRISPLEARMTDPQQRMLLETTWQALEDAGIDPDGLKGSRTGIYAGIGASEYRDVISARGQADLYFGTSGSMTVGRIAFILGLEGPALPVDMACASSLAAVHQAAAALQRGEVSLALAGGVNTTLSLPLARFHRDFGMLSARGRCNAFDVNADGFVRSEGCGMLVLKRLSQAEADGDRIWGLVRGTAVNQSGASAALPVPNGPAQERVMEDALAQGGIAPAEVDYLEAHGTGTELGDSIELRALASVYGRGREQERPLLLGSVKTNIGHAEWASGMASIIKAALAMKRGLIPAHLHFREPNPAFDWERVPVRITSEKTAWPATGGRPPRAAVNAFGLSGANAHVILEGYGDAANGAQPANGALRPTGGERPAPISLPARFAALDPANEPEPDMESKPGRTARLLPLSAKSPEALRELAGAYRSWLEEGVGAINDETEAAALLANMSWTAGAGRAHFSHRAGLVFRDAAELYNRLTELAQADNSSDKATEPIPAVAPRVAFLYPGAGSQWAGMGEALYRTEPVIRAVLDCCDQLLREERGASLLDVMFGRAGAAYDLSQPEWAHPAIYALEVALTALWESVGVRPGVVLGQGIGELAAAQAAGVLTLEGGLRLAAALTGPEAALPRIPANPPALTWVSGVTGRVVSPTDAPDNAYWRRLAGESNTFSDALPTLAGDGAGLMADLLVELGPRAEEGDILSPHLASFGGETQPRLLDGLVRPGSGLEAAGAGFLRAVAAAYEAGLPLSFPGLFAGERPRRVALPGYPFQRRSFWVQSRNAAG